jgi:nucleolar GTP-binding protein
MPTIVVAGPPNVGKSTLVRVVSTAKPEIATYPFTTKTLILGHIKLNGRVYQILDTPGLLDRPLTERNRIELQAIMALRHVADLIVFMVDPSETCGYSLDMQLSLYNDIKKSFNIPIIPTINKVDVSPPEMLEKAKKVVGDDVIEMAALKGIGIKELIEKFRSFFEKSS